MRILWQVPSSRAPVTGPRRLPAPECGCRAALILLALLSSATVFSVFSAEITRADSSAHWAFQPISRPDIPGTEAAGNPANPVDRFVVHALARANLSPSPTADRRTLIRRLFLDMTGLPPAANEVEAFVHDRRPDAWPRLVDRVLAAPGYGERWAQHWLDPVRYSDSNGFETNRQRPNAWPYRDYVIRAFNEDKPFDRFVFEQIAGDTIGVDEATGFLVAGPHNITTGSEVRLQKIARQQELADLVNAVGTTFAGLTIGCARCHDHKSDPITQTDYYSMLALVAGVHHGDRLFRRAEFSETQAEIKSVANRIQTLLADLTPYRRPLSDPVQPGRNIESFEAVTARTIRFTVLETNDGTEAALDEIEIYSARDLPGGQDRFFAHHAFEIPDGNAPRGLLAHWTFDEGAGSTVRDRVGGRVGVAHGTRWVPGFNGSGGALEFDGHSSYLFVGAEQTALNLDAAAGYTLSWWQLWRGPNGAPQRILNMDDGEDLSGGFAVLLSDDGLLSTHNDGSNRNWIAPFPHVPRWQHVAIVWDGSVRSLFVDGILTGRQPTPSPIRSDGDDPLLIGATPYRGITQFYGGQLDDIRLYNVPLDPRQVLAFASNTPDPFLDGDGNADTDTNTDIETENAGPIDTARPRNPESAVLTFAAADHARFWLNGHEVGQTRSPRLPATLEVGQWLKPGINILAAEVWAEGDANGLAAELNIRDGANPDRTRSVRTGPGWRVTRIPEPEPDNEWRTSAPAPASWTLARDLGKLGRSARDPMFPRADQEAGNRETGTPPVSWIWFPTPGATNVALASAGARAVSSSDRTDNPLRHAAAHVNDGQFGDKRAWVAGELRNAWIEIELPEPARIDRLIWSRDREGTFTDRLPIAYRIDTALQSGDWRPVASSDQRLPVAAIADERLRYDFNGAAPADRRQLDARFDQLRELRRRVNRLRQRPARVYAGEFKEPEPIHVLHRGDPERPMRRVTPDVVSALDHRAGPNLDESASDPERRVALAKWLVHPENPLPARVIVNRIWQHHFGTGLVATPNDFGRQGAGPSHPLLLDWLASRFIDDGWSIKRLHRIILLSNTYRQSSRWRTDAAAVDAGNRLLWRFPSRRLEAEAIRDGILSVAGNLDRSIGGPGFDLFHPTKHNVRVYVPLDQLGPEHWRRMIYRTRIRMESDGVFGAFDIPDGGLPCAARSRTTTAVQALNLFNSEFTRDQAIRFADRIRDEPGADRDPQARIESVFRHAYARLPSNAEREAAARLARRHGLAAVCRAVFNSNEFLVLP